MFLVGGGILVHGIPPVAELLHHVEALAKALPFGGILAAALYNGLFGILAGGLIVGVVSVGKRLLPGGRGTSGH
jgi:predicted DNA repair protein MutK